MRKYRARQCLVDAAVERVVQRLLASLPQIFAHAVEDDDRVVQRVAEHGEQCGHDGQRDFEVHQFQECERREDVVRRRDDGGQSEAPLEPNREVDKRDGEREQDRDDGISAQLIADGRGRRPRCVAP